MLQMVDFCLNFERKIIKTKAKSRQNPKTRNPKKIRILRNSPHETLQKNTPKSGFAQTFKQNQGLKQSFFKNKILEFFLCVSVSKTRKKKVYC